jgi:hypothetical protein
MDASERIVDIYLRSLGYTDIVYEPDGNVPPDFLVNKRIAIEVRRLNQNVKSATGGTEGIEEAFIPLWQAMYRYLPTFGPSARGESWWVTVNMRRPIEPWRKLRPLIKSALENFMQSAARQATKLEITRQLKLSLMPAGVPLSSFFVLGGGIDFEAGGFVLAEVLRNLAICIEEKERKVAPHRHRYPEWWLVLPDHIGRGLDAADRHQFRELPAPLHSWDKVVLVDPSNPAHAFEI